MRLLERFAPPAPKQRAPAPGGWVGGWMSGFSTMGNTQPGNYGAMVDAYYSWCFSAASAIGNDMMSIDWRLYVPTSEDKRYLTTHPFLDIVRRNNEEFSWPFLINFATISCELTGNGYLFKNRDKLDVTRELWPLLPHEMRVVPGDPSKGEPFIVGYLYGKGSKAIGVDARDVIHLRYPNPKNIYYGMGTVEAARHSIDINELMKEYDIALMSNGGVPSGVIHGEKALTRDERKLLRAEWEDRHGGARNAGKLAILTKGFKYERIQMNPVDLQYMEQKKMVRDETFAMFKMPRSKVGMADDINRANAEAGDYTFGRNVILPRLKLFKADLTTQLIDEYDSRIELEHSSPIPVDEPHKLKQATDGVKFGVVRVNEGRALIGLPPVEGGDVFLWPVNVDATAGGEREGRVSSNPKNDDESAA